MNKNNFLAELKRRNVYKVAVAYAVVAWLLIQAASILFPTFDAPGWVMKVFVTAVLLGFPVALILAWAFELTPEGIKRAEETLPNESITRRTGRKLVGITVALAMIAAGLLLFRMVGTGRRAVRSGNDVEGRRSAASRPDKSIAVLPFASLSEDKANAYFADGIQDEILTRLSKVAELKVISRTSTQQYQSKPGKISAIAQELGVSHILEGSVQKSGDTVRVNVQLIKAEGDSHLWADTYDRKLTDIFAVETEVAQRIAASLEAQLSGGEKTQIAAVPTTNPQAYDAYLRGLALIRRQPLEDVVKGRDFLRHAVALDPNYAQAWAQIAIAEAQIYLGLEHTPACQARARSAAETAVRLQPELSEARAALGFFYYTCLQDYDRALAELQEARKGLPNDANTLFYIGLVKRRQGKLDESIEFLRRATISDPRNQDIWGNLGRSYRGKRDFARAREMFDRAFAVSPDEMQFMGDKAETYLAQGDLEAADKILQNAARQNLDGMAGEHVALLLYRHQFEDALVAAKRAVESAKARPQLSIVEDKAWLGELQLLAGHPAEGRALLDPALRGLLALQSQGDTNLRLFDGILLASAALGDRAKVEQQAAALRKATGQDLWRAPESEEVIAVSYAILGDADAALPLLEHCLSAFYRRAITPSLLRLDPVWDRIRDDPRFRKLAQTPP
ncbi:MAG: tetratricopeptide repeat protein [Chthoniobacterales bacterium]